MNRTLILLLAAGFGLAVVPLQSAIYHVSVSGNDGNAGSQDRPWRTVQKAVDSVVAGDTVRVRAGVYDEDLKVTKGGVSGKPVTLDGQGVATIKRVTVKAPYVTVQNFTVKGWANAWSCLMTLDLGSHHATISNNILDVGGAANVGALMIALGRAKPFDQSASSDSVIKGNTITGTRGYTTVQLGGTGNTFEGNRVVNVVQSDFLRLWGQNNVIRGNVFSNNVAAAGIGFHMDFVQTFGDNGYGSRGHVIERNLVADIPDGQVSQLVETNLKDAGAIGGWTFRNNVFARIGLQASISIPSTKWVNNIFYRCNTRGGHVLTLGNSARGRAEGAVVVNNVFLDCGGLEQNNSGWYTRGYITNLTADYNLVAKNKYQPVREENPPTPFRWYEPHGLNGMNPRFVSDERLDFQLRDDSPLIDRGLDFKDNRADFLGAARPRGGGWDIGAFESSATGVGLPPDAPTGLRMRAGP